MYLDIPQISEFENTEFLTIITDSEGVIQFISPSKLDILGVEPNKVVFELHYLKLFDAGCKENIEKKISETKDRKKKETGYFSVQLNKKDLAPEIKLNISLLYNKKDDFKGFLATFKTAGQNLNAEGEYEKMLDHIPLGIYRTKLNGEIIYVNQSLLDIFHFNSKEDIGNSNMHFVDKDYRKRQVNEWIDSGNYSAEFYAYTKEGEVICVKDEGKVIKDKDGNVLYFDGVLEDITGQKEAEIQLKELNLSKDKFLSIISHDLKVPFGQFITATELILDKIHDFEIEQIEKLVYLLNEQAVKGYKLLENLLEWSRNQKGLIEFNPQPVDLHMLTNEVIEGLKQLAENKSIIIDAKIKNGLFIYADCYMLSTIIRNLISNAIKFTDKNGQITISSKYVLAKDTIGDKYLEFSVADTGVGIRKEDISKLFRIDTAFSSKGTQKESGTGLGLILCKDFVEKHGGKIWVESGVGKGSTFRFTLP